MSERAWRGVPLVCPRCRAPSRSTRRGPRAPRCGARYPCRGRDPAPGPRAGGRPGLRPPLLRHPGARRGAPLLVRGPAGGGPRRAASGGAGPGPAWPVRHRLRQRRASGVPRPAGSTVAGACDAYLESLEIVRRRVTAPLVLVDEGRLPPLGPGHAAARPVRRPRAPRRRPRDAALPALGAGARGRSWSSRCRPTRFSSTSGTSSPTTGAATAAGSCGRSSRRPASRSGCSPTSWPRSCPRSCSRGASDPAPAAVAAPQPGPAGPRVSGGARPQRAAARRCSRVERPPPGGLAAVRVVDHRRREPAGPARLRAGAERRPGRRPGRGAGPLSRRIEPPMIGPDGYDERRRPR